MASGDDAGSRSPDLARRLLDNDHSDRRRSRSRSRSPNQRRRSYSRSRSRSPVRRDRLRSRSPAGRGYGGDRGGGGRARSGIAIGSRATGRKVYVGNLAYDVKWTQLKDFMRSAGEVIHADVLTGRDGRSRGCGVVEFATVSDAQRAIDDLNEVNLNGRNVFIREDREADKGDRGGDRGGRGGRGLRDFEPRPSRSTYVPQITQTTSPQLFVMNLPYSVTWQDLKDLFRGTGTVVRADVGQTPEGRSKGSGTILFETVAEAQRAITQFQGYNWQGRVIELKEDKFARDSMSGGGGRDGGRRGSGSYDRGHGDRHGSFSGGRSGGYDGGFAQPAAPSQPVEPNPFTDHAWGGGETSDTIFVKNLPWSTSDEDLVELFVTIGPVAQAEICYEPSGRSKGMGVVRFDEQEHAEVAIQRFSGYQYGGRPLNLSYVRYESNVPTGPAAGADGAPQQYAATVPSADVVMEV